jgi:ABC-type amino acid transport substrate-binding protein
MKTFLRLSSVVIALSTAAGPAFAGCLVDVKAKGEIIAGVGSMGQKPLIWQTTGGGYDGFEWELYKYIGTQLGVTPKFEITEWTTLIPGLQAKRWDIILSGMTITQERAQGGNIDFSYPYMMFYDGIIVKTDSPIKSIEDLKGKKLGSVLGSMDSLNAHMMVDEGKAGEVLDFNGYGDPFEALRTGQIDAVLLDQASYLGQKETMPDLRRVGDVIYFHPRAGWEDKEAKTATILGAVGVAVPKECPDLSEAINAAIKKFDSTGLRKEAMEKYGMWEDAQAKLFK